MSACQFKEGMIIHSFCVQSHWREVPAHGIFQLKCVTKDIGSGLLHQCTLCSLDTHALFFLQHLCCATPGCREVRSYIVQLHIMTITHALDYLPPFPLPPCKTLPSSLKRELPKSCNVLRHAYPLLVSLSTGSRCSFHL